MKVNFNSLKLKLNTEVTEVTIGEVAIEVKNYVPVAEKIKLVNDVLNASREGKRFDDIKMDAYFHLFLVDMYTNLTFTEKQMEEALKTYDVLESNGVIDKIVEAIGVDNYDEMYEAVHSARADVEAGERSLGLVLDKMLVEVPSETSEGMQAINDFDMTKFAEVINFATAANGGRNIETNQPMEPIEVKE